MSIDKDLRVGNTASYSATDVASWILSKVSLEQDSITHLKLQKIVYYAQAWSLALLDRELFKEDLEAWAHGPVAVSVWDKLKDNTYNSLPYHSLSSDVVFNEETESLLNEVFDTYIRFQAKELEDMTHREKPWLEARGGLSPEERCKNPINKKTMETFFKSLYTSVNA